MKAIILETIVGVALFIICGLTLIRLFSNHELKTEQDKEELNYYHTNYLQDAGMTAFWPGSYGKLINYDFRSFDGGKNWYAVSNEDNGFIILGDAKTVQPGLFQITLEWNNIMNYVTTNGPITTTDTQGIQLLVQANQLQSPSNNGTNTFVPPYLKQTNEKPIQHS